MASVGKLLLFPGQKPVRRSRGVAAPRACPADRPSAEAATGRLTVHNVGKAFKKRPVLRGVSLDLRRGEVVGLLGPNGAGKTTCFYMITGLVPPDHGTILLDGHDVT